MATATILEEHFGDRHDAMEFAYAQVDAGAEIVTVDYDYTEGYHPGTSRKYWFVQFIPATETLEE